MYWLNIDLPWGIWKIHRKGCRHINPRETKMKGLNEMKDNGGWYSFQTFQEAYEYYLKHGPNDTWQPCKICKPE